MAFLALAWTSSVFAQSAPIEQPKDSLPVPKNLENFNEFQVVKWGPVTYKGEGKCDILDLYQKNVTDGLGYSTVVDYHSKETKQRGKYTCESWGLGLAFSVVPDSNVNSENYGLRNNRATSFSARGKDPVKKFYAGDSTFLELESITPVTYRTEGHCYAVDFLVNMANETSGYHGIIDMKAGEFKDGDKDSCVFWGLAVKYKHRDVVEKVVTKKRIVEIIKVPAPKPDTIIVPVPVAKQPTSRGCCMACCCDN